MTHSLTTTPAPAPAIPISTKPKKTTSYSVPSLGFHRVWAALSDSKTVSNSHFVDRRNVSLGLAVALLGLNVGGRSAKAAARRPPPPPPEEKKDPNVSGVQAKVLASKKRKEAMKASVAKLREGGKVITEPSRPNQQPD